MDLHSGTFFDKKWSIAKLSQKYLLELKKFSFLKLSTF